MSSAEDVRLFGMRFRMLQSDLEAVEKDQGIDLGLVKNDAKSSDKDESYYPQFEEVVRREAAAMARHYEIFYCLEKSIRRLVRETMQEAKGATWFDTAAPNNVKDSVNKNIQKEADAGLTPRSVDPLDYTNFGELGDIVRANWDVFTDTFNNDKAFNKIMASLNLLRSPIAHCSPLAPDEVLRLQLTLKDWFRLME
jgi:hypothetical protein